MIHLPRNPRKAWQDPTRLRAAVIAAIAACLASAARAAQRTSPPATGPSAPSPAAARTAARATARRAHAAAAVSERASHKINWLNPTTWPVLPVPLTAVDPLSGTTLGVIPTILHTNSAGQITRIIAPDVNYNPYFGWGWDARIYEYPSPNTQWFLTGGANQHVQSGFDGKFETGRLRDSLLSWSVEAVYDRNGTPRFYGIGNNSLRINQTVYTDQQMWVNGTVGWNITHAWQLAYTFIARKVKIGASRLIHLPSITQRFKDILGLGTTHELLNRVSMVYDTRNNIVIPTRGAYIIAYGGIASRNVDIGDSLFTETGVDARFYWSPSRTLTVATHFDVRYEPTANHVPFWGLSRLGGDEDVIGGSQPLRGYGSSRFYARNALVANIELRKTVLSFHALSTHIEIQVTPFFDTGRVFSHGFLPLYHLHNVVGIGFRGIAPPSVVGYVDIGRGSEGTAVFTGIGFPF